MNVHIGNNAFLWVTRIFLALAQVMAWCCQAPSQCLIQCWYFHCCEHFDGLVQERRSSIANALELHLSHTNPLTYSMDRCKTYPQLPQVTLVPAMYIIFYFLPASSQSYKVVNVDVDSNQKSDRSEWATARYHAYYSPMSAFELEVQWLVATGSILGDLVSWH